MLTSGLKAVTTLGDTPVMILLTLVLALYLLYRRKREKGFFAIAVMFSSALFIFLLKELFHRARPLHGLVFEESFSFPSGHATISVVFFGLLVFFFHTAIPNRAKRWAFIVASVFLILLIGFSRIYLNVHWVSDVLAGYLLGALILATSFRVWKL